MEAALIVAAGLALIINIISAFELLRGNRRLILLTDTDTARGPDLPLVSVVVAARDEASTLKPAMSSLLGQEYPNFEVVAVNDRSGDGTGALLDGMAASDNRLRVIHVGELPAGWLGKTYALHLGAEAAGGEILLFTDADVVMAPSAVARAVRFLEEHGLDHLAVGPRVIMPVWALEMVCLLFFIFFALHTKPWRAIIPGHRAHIGIGAFNMVRRRAYAAAGGHRRIALRPDDDLKLGKILKDGGARQDMVMSAGLVRVIWYYSLPAMVRGLMKNSFAVVDYSLAMVILYLTGIGLLTVWPFIGVFVAGGWQLWLNAADIALILWMAADSAPIHGIRRRFALGIPLAAVIMSYIVSRAAALALLRGRISWRETGYSLKELRRNKV